jgi:hypothetical protein
MRKDKAMEKTWQNWFSAWAIGVFFFGLVLAGGAFDATDGLTNALFTLFGNPVPSEPGEHYRFSVGLMGAVTMGWGLTFWVAFKALSLIDAATAAPLWRKLTLFTLVWYVVDSYISVATGFWMNAVSNTIVMTLYFIPLFKSGVMKA